MRAQVLRHQLDGEKLGKVVTPRAKGGWQGQHEDLKGLNNVVMRCWMFGAWGQEYVPAPMSLAMEMDPQRHRPAGMSPRPETFNPWGRVY